MSEQRSVKISDDERGGWSSDRPRPGAPRPVDISTRCRVLRASDRLRYSPGSLVVVISPSAEEREKFVARVFQDEKGTVFSPVTIRRMLAGKVADDAIAATAAQLIEATVTKRIDAGDSVVVPVEGLESPDREKLTRIAHAKRRPRHLIFLDTAVPDEERAAVNELRTRLDAGDLGAEGFQTALRLSTGALGEVKRILFRSAPKDDS